MIVHELIRRPVLVTYWLLNLIGATNEVLPLLEVITVLCYTLVMELSPNFFVQQLVLRIKHNTLWEMGLCIPPLPILSCEAASII